MEIWFCVDQVPDKWTEKGVGVLVRTPDLIDLPVGKDLAARTLLDVW
jgi:hypothetical protein